MFYPATVGTAWRGEQNDGVRLTVTIVLLLRSINGSVCLQLQVKTLSAVQLCHDALQLGLCGGRGSKETGRRERETTIRDKRNKRSYSDVRHSFLVEKNETFTGNLFDQSWSVELDRSGSCC